MCCFLGGHGGLSVLREADIPEMKIRLLTPGAKHLHQARQFCSKITQKDIEKDLKESTGKFKRLGSFEEEA